MTRFLASLAQAFMATARRRRQRFGERFESLETRKMLTPQLVGGVQGASLGPVDINSDLQLTFSEPVFRGSSGEIRLYHELGRMVESFPIGDTSRISIAGAELTINPTWDLDGSAGFYLTIDANSLQGSDGSGFSGVNDSSRLAFRSGYEVLQIDAASAMRDQFPGTVSEAIGDHRALYMRVTFPDVNRAPNTLSQASEDMETTGISYLANSKGVMSLSTTYTPVITLPFSHSWLSTFDTSVNGLGLVQSGAQAEAVKLGFRMEDYDVRIVRVDRSLRDGASWGGGDSVWLAWGGASVILHEAGHALGLGHAESADFSGGVSEYGNPLDWMGGGGSKEDQFGVQTQAALGWVSQGDVLANPGNGIQRLYALDSGRNGVGQYLGITQSIAADTLGSNPVYTIEYRPQQGGGLSTAAVLLRNRQLIDTTPGSSGGFYDGGVNLGQTYRIPGSDAWISVVGAGDGYIDVDIQTGTFAENVAPMASFTATATQAKRFDEVTFRASALDANGDHLLFSWVFSDGVTAAGPEFTRSFRQSAAGNVTAELRVSDRRGGVATLSTTIAVGATTTSGGGTFGTLTPPSYSLPSVSIVAEDAFAGEGGDAGSLRISRIGTATDNPLTVALSYAGSGLSVFSTLPSSVVIPAGASSVSVPLNPADDSQIQSLRKLSASLTSSSDYVISSQNASASVSISDNDSTVLSIVAIDSVAAEAAAPVRDTGSFLIRRTGPVDQALTVYFGIAGSAMNGGDYGRLDGQTVIPAGHDSVVVLINPMDDATGENSETVTLMLAAFNDAYSVGPQSTATVTINDASDRPRVSLRAAGSAAVEGGNGQVVFEVVGGDGSAVTIPYTVTGTATAGTDYESLSGTIVVPAGVGVRSASLDIKTLTDSQQEDDETIVITLAASSMIQNGPDATAVVQLQDPVDTANGQDRLRLSRHFSSSAAFSDPAEDPATPLVFWIYRDNSTSARTALPVTFLLGGTATPGTDYTGVIRAASGTQLGTFSPSATNTVTIPADAAGLLIELVPVVDAVVEGTESITLTLQSVAGGSVVRPLGVNRSATVNLRDSDASPVSVSFTTLVSLTEEPDKSSWGQHRVQVKLSQASSQNVTVSYRASGGSALGLGADWAFAVPAANTAPVTSGTLTFEPGQTTKEISVWIQADRISESAEFFDLVLISPTGASLDAARSSHRVTLYDVVPDGLIMESRWSTTAVYDGNTWDTVAANYEGYLDGLTTPQNVANSYSRRLTGVITAPVTGDYYFYVAADDAAKLYLSTSENAAQKSLIASTTNWTNFQQWDKYTSQKSAVISLVAGQRYYVEVQQKDVGGGDHVSVGWTYPGQSTVQPISTAAPALSLDNRYVQLLRDTGSLAEGESTDLVVTLDRVSQSPVTVNLAVIGGTAAQGTDFSTGNLTVTFAPGELSRFVTLTALADGTGEAAERVTISLASAVGAKISGISQYTATIRDASAPSIAAATGLVERGQAAGSQIVQVSATFAAGRSLQEWQIVGGNPRLQNSDIPAFAIDAQGRITISNPDAIPLTSVSLPLTVRAVDNLGASSLQSVTIVANGQRLREERWNDSSIYSSGDFSAKANVSNWLTSFDAARDVADYYTRRITGVFTPPQTGAYSFWIAALDGGRLTIAPAGNPDSEVELATSKDAAYQAWDGSYLQESAPQQLVAGQSYILRGYQYDSYWGDHLSVAWSGPGFARVLMPASAFLRSMAENSFEFPPLTDSTPGSVSGYSLAQTAVTDTGIVASINAGQNTRDQTLGLSGTAPAGADIRLYAGQVLVAQTSALTDGTWAAITSQLAEGTHDFRAEVIDEWGNIAITQPVSFLIRTKIDVENPGLLSTEVGGGSWTTSGPAVGAVQGFASGNQGVFVYSATTGTVSDLFVTDGSSGQAQLVTRSASAANTSAAAATTYAGVAGNGSFVVFGSNAATSFGTAGTAFTDTQSLQTGPYSDLFTFDRTSGQVSLLTFGSNSSTTRSRQAQFTGVSADNRYVVFTSDYAESIGNFTSPQKPQSAKWVLVDGGYPTSTAKKKLTSLRVADIDPTTFTFALSGGWITNDGAAASVSQPTISRATGSLTFWVQALDDTHTKAVKLELTDAADGISVKATAAKYTSGNQANFNWNSSGTSASVAGSLTAAGYGVSVLEAVGTSQTEKMLAEGTVPIRDVFAFDATTGQQRLLSHSAAAGYTASGSANVSNVMLSRDGRYVLFNANDATRLGNNGTAFIDAFPSVPDLFAADLQTGEIRLLSARSDSSVTSAGVAVTLHGSASSGAYAVFSANDATPFGFTDSAPAAADLFVADLTNGSVRLITRSGGSITSSMAQVGTFEQIAGNAVFFTAADATKLGFSTDAGAALRDLFRFDLTTGAISLISHAVANTQQALNGEYLAGSMAVSPDGRFVAFAEALAGSNGGFTESQNGEALLMTDLQTDTIRLLNGGNAEGSSLSYGAWAGISSRTSWPRYFTPDSRNFVWQTSYTGWIALENRSHGPNADAQYGAVVLSFDLSGGVLDAGLVQYSRVLSHTAASVSQIGVGSKLLGVSGDSRFAVFSANDATSFGNGGVAFADTATTATDLFAVDLSTRRIELLSGANLASFGQTATFHGVTDGNAVVFGLTGVGGISALQGTLTDSNGAGGDLVTRRLDLIDLPNADDTSADGTATDNVTTRSNFTLTSWAPPGRNVQLLDGTTVVGTQTAPASGRIIWQLTNVPAGVHQYSLWFPEEGIPFTLNGALSRSAVSVTVVGGNGPVDIDLSPRSLQENSGTNATVGTFSTTTNGAADSFTYTLVTGAGSTDNSAFSISGRTLQMVANADFESKSNYSIRVRCTDAGGLWFEQAFQIDVSDVNESPTGTTLSASTIAENLPANSVVGEFNSTDPDAGDTFTWSLVTGSGDADNALFEIDGTELKALNSFNFESRSSYSIRVRSTDAGGLWFERTFQIDVSNVNESPTGTSLSASTIAENSAANSTVGSLSSSDPDAGDTFTWSLVTGSGDADNALFQISGTALKALNSFDFESRASYSIRVRSTDAGGLWFERTFQIDVTDVNESPTGTFLSSSTIAENSPANSVVGEFSSTDPDAGDTFTWSLVTGSGDVDNALFTIDGTELKALNSFNFESRSSYSIRVRSTDAGELWFERTLQISVSNVNESPTSTSLSASTIAENSPANSVVGEFSSTDPDAGDTFTWSLVTGTGSADNALFQVDGTRLKALNSFDFESRSSYSIRVRSTDAGGLSFERTFVVGVINVDDTRPQSRVQSPATPTTRNMTITATATDPGADSTGVARVRLYYSTGGTYTEFAVVTPESLTATFAIPSSYTTYWFRSIAEDIAGNVETKSTFDVSVAVGDVDWAETQVTSATADDYGKVVLQLSGTRPGREKLSEFVVYCSIDNAVAVEIGRVTAGVPNSSGVYSAQIVYQALADNNAHTWKFYSVGIDTIGKTEAAPENPDVVLSRSFTPAPIRPLGIDVQLGVKQRSYVRYLDVLFSQTSGVSELANTNRIQVERFSITATSVTAGNGSPVTVVTFQTIGSRVRLDFGSNGLGGLRQNGDGFYRARLDMNNDGIFGGSADAEFEFFRLFGDANGDGAVTVDDTNLVSSQLGRSGSGLEADVDGNGAVNALDRLYTTQRRNFRLRDWMLTWLDD